MPDYETVPVDHDPFTSFEAVDHDPFSEHLSRLGQIRDALTPEWAKPFAGMTPQQERAEAQALANPNAKPGKIGPGYLSDTQRLGSATADVASSLLPELKAAGLAVKGMWMGATPTAKLAGEAAEEVAPKVIQAYHGSPHDFDKFDVSKTNQGIWLAKEPDIADKYTFGTGNLYRVNINAPIESFINRSDPLDSQSESVRNAISSIENDVGMSRRKGANGGDFYSDLARKLTGHGPALQGIIKANNLLRERGIPGITDGDAHVVFDDKLLNITHKNGIPVSGVDLQSFPVDHDPFANQK